MNKKSKPKAIQDPRILEVGKRLRELRIEQGFSSYEAFAWEHGINRVQYWRMETGQNFTLESLFKVLDAMKITTSEFFDGME